MACQHQDCLGETYFIIRHMFICATCGRNLDFHVARQMDLICVRCKEEPFGNCNSEAGRREVRISGLCEKCFDEIMDSGEEESEIDEEEPF